MDGQDSRALMSDAAAIQSQSAAEHRLNTRGENRSQLVVRRTPTPGIWNPVKIITIASLALGVWIAANTKSILYGQSIDPLDYETRKNRLLSETPLIDGHNDLPFLVRLQLNNQIYGDNLPFDTGESYLGPRDTSCTDCGCV